MNMSRLTLRLPETLHQQLTELADGEGVSLNQYIVYALTRQATLAYTVQVIPETEVERQQQEFEVLKQKLRKGSLAEIEAALAAREPVEPDPELNLEAVARLQERIRKRA
jgi:uncharacterized protein (DUF1778 family)